MQRVRIGLTGLAFVFVAVLLAAIFGRASDEEPITADRIEEVAVGHDTTNSIDPIEPLAELGVAPGSENATNAATADTVSVEDPLRPQRRR